MAAKRHALMVANSPKTRGARLNSFFSPLLAVVASKWFQIGHRDLHIQSKLRMDFMPLDVLPQPEWTMTTSFGMRCVTSTIRGCKQGQKDHGHSSALRKQVYERQQKR